MFLVVGLGNPGQQYRNTRHNAGFLVVEEIARRSGVLVWRNERDSESGRCRLGGEEALLVKPTTFMNRSGEAVRRIAHFHRVPLSDVIVVHDELDIPFGTIRVKVGGGDAGHNGLKSITQHLGGPGYCRVRVGIGRPSHPEMAVADWVLGVFGAAEAANLSEVIKDAAEVIEEFVRGGLQKAQQRASGRLGARGREKET